MIINRSLKITKIFGGLMQDFILIDKIDYQFWPIIKMEDGTIRKGYNAEIVGRWKESANERQ